MPKKQPSIFSTELARVQKQFWRSCVERVDSSPAGGAVTLKFEPADPSRGGSTNAEKFCVRDVLVFEPLKQFDPEIVNHYICPKCEQKVFFGTGGTPQLRTVLGLTDHSLLVFKKYRCDCGCKFRNIDDEVLKKMPDIVRVALFSLIVIRNRSAMTVELQNHMYEVHKECGQRPCAKILNRSYRTHFATLHAKFLALASISNKRGSQARQTTLEKSWKGIPKARKRRYRPRTDEEVSQNDQFKIASDVLHSKFKTKNGSGIDVEGLGNKKIEDLKNTSVRVDSLSEEEKSSFVHLEELAKGISTAYQLSQLHDDKMGTRELQIFLNSNLNLKKKSNITEMRKIAGNWVKNACKALDNEIHMRVQQLPQSRRERAAFQRDQIEAIITRGRVEDADLVVEEIVDTEEEVPSNGVVEAAPLPKDPILEELSFPNYSEANGYTFRHKKISQVCFEVFDDRKDLIMQTLASKECHFLSFDSQLKAEKWVMVKLPGSNKKIPILRSVLCGLNQVGQVVVLHCEDFLERNEELEYCLTNLKETQEEMFGSNHKIHACWTDKCCTRRKAIQKSLGNQCSSLLDLFHFMDRFEAVFEGGKENPHYGQFMKDFSNTMKLKGDQATTYLQKKGVSVDQLLGAGAAKTYPRYKSEIDIIPDPVYLHHRFETFISKYHRMDVVAKVKNMRITGNHEKRVSDAIAEETGRRGRILTKDEEEDIRGSIPKPKLEPILFKDAVRTKSRTFKFREFCKHQAEHITNGCLSDPLHCGKPLFYLTKNADQAGYVLQTVRGTSKVENWFKQMKARFGNRKCVGPRLAELLLLETAFETSESVLAKIHDEPEYLHLAREYCLQANSYAYQHGIARSNLPYPAHKGSILDPKKLKFGFFVAGSDSPSPSRAMQSLARNALSSLQRSIGRGLATGKEDLKFRKDVTTDGRSCDRSFWAALQFGLHRNKLVSGYLPQVFGFFPPYTDFSHLLSTNSSQESLKVELETKFRKHLASISSEIASGKFKGVVKEQQDQANLGLYKNGTDLDASLLQSRFFHSSSEETLLFIHVARAFTLFLSKEICQAEANKTDSIWFQQLKCVLDKYERERDASGSGTISTDGDHDTEADRITDKSELEVDGDNDDEVCGVPLSSQENDEEDTSDQEDVARAESSVQLETDRGIEPTSESIERAIAAVESTEKKEQSLLERRLYLEKLSELERRLCAFGGSWKDDHLPKEAIAGWEYLSLITLVLQYFLKLRVIISQVDDSGGIVAHDESFSAEHLPIQQDESDRDSESETFSTLTISLGSGRKGDSYFPLIPNLDYKDHDESEEGTRKGTPRRRETGFDTLKRLRNNDQYFSPFSWEPAYTYERQIAFWLVRKGYLEKMSTGSGGKIENFTLLFNQLVTTLNAKAVLDKTPLRFKGSSVLQYLRLKTSEKMKEFLTQANCFLETNFQLSRNIGNNWFINDDDEEYEFSDEEGCLFDFLIVGDVNVIDELEEDAEEAMSSLSRNYQAPGGLLNASNIVTSLTPSFPESIFAPFVMNTVSPQGLPDNDKAKEPVKKRGRGANTEAKKKKRKQAKSDQLGSLSSTIQEVDEMIGNLATVIPEIEEFGKCRDLLSNQRKVIEKLSFLVKHSDTATFSSGISNYASIDGQSLRCLLGVAEAKNPVRWFIHGYTVVRFLHALQLEQISSTGLEQNHGPIKWSFRIAADFSTCAASTTKSALFPLIHRWGSAQAGLDSDLILSPYLENDHWSLFAIYPRLRSIFHFDSLPGLKNENNIVAAAKLEVRNLVELEKLQRLQRDDGDEAVQLIDPDFKNWVFESPQCLRQQNSDCGPILLLNSFRLIHGVPVHQVGETYVSKVLRGHIALKIWASRHQDLSLDSPEIIAGHFWKKKRCTGQNNSRENPVDVDNLAT